MGPSLSKWSPAFEIPGLSKRLPAFEIQGSHSPVVEDSSLVVCDAVSEGTWSEMLRRCYKPLTKCPEVFVQ